jgi:hypothetical protein
MVKGVMTNWTIVCSVSLQCYPEVAVQCGSIQSSLKQPEAWSCQWYPGCWLGNFSLFSFVSLALFCVIFLCSHLCLLLCQWYPVLQSLNLSICSHLCVFFFSTTDFPCGCFEIVSSGRIWRFYLCTCAVYDWGKLSYDRFDSVDNC